MWGRIKEKLKQAFMTLLALAILLIPFIAVASLCHAEHDSSHPEPPHSSRKINKFDAAGHYKAQTELDTTLKKQREQQQLTIPATGALDGVPVAPQDDEED